MLTVLVGVLTFVLAIGWALGRDVVESIDPSEVIEEARVARGAPRWVDKELFSGCSARFYDWSRLGKREWQCLHSAITDYYAQARNDIVGTPEFVGEENIDNLVFEYASAGAYDVHEFEAALKTVLLIIVHPKIWESVDRATTFAEVMAVQRERFLNPPTEEPRKGPP